MGAGASVFKRKAATAKGQDKTKAEANVKEETADVQHAEVDAIGEGGQGNAYDGNRLGQEEFQTAIEGIDDVLCRLAQAHPTQTPQRWGLIAKKLNRAMRKKGIPARPLKDLLAKQTMRLPQCWVTEIAENAKARELAKETAQLDEKKGVFGGKPVFGGKTKTFDKNVAGDLVAGESDTEPESDLEKEEGKGENPTDQEGGVVDGDGLVYMYQRLTKYEVFSYMQKLHDRTGPRLLETEEAKADIHRVEERVDALYEELPVGTAKAISQENAITAGLRHDSLAYGEIDTVFFLKVLVKLKRIHGHMIEPGGSFWDLGAGVGKLVIAAAMMHNFESCYGVELLEGLRNASSPMLNRWRKEEVQKLKAAKAAIRVEFMFSDVMKQHGWVSEATLLYVHTNFSAVDLHELRRRAEGMKVGAICLSVSLPAVNEDKWGLLAVENVVTSWGATKLYIHEKLV